MFIPIPEETKVSELQDLLIVTLLKNPSRNETDESPSVCCIHPSVKHVPLGDSRG